MKPLFPSLLVGTLLLGAGLAAQAQNTPPAAPPSDHPPMHQGGPGHWDHAKMEAMHAKHLAELKAKLKITPAQEAAWTTFTTAMKPPAQPMEHEDHAALDKLTTPERIDKMHEMRAKRMAEHQAAMDQHEQAIKTFYATLGDDQKKTFDAEHARMMHAMEHMRAGHPAKKAMPATPATPAAPSAPAKP